MCKGGIFSVGYLSGGLHLSLEFSVLGVAVPGGSLCQGSLFWGGLCPGWDICPERSLSRGHCPGVSVPKVLYPNESLSPGVCLGWGLYPGVSLLGSLSRWGRSLSRSLCLGGLSREGSLCPDGGLCHRDSPLLPPRTG